MHRRIDQLLSNGFANVRSTATSPSRDQSRHRNRRSRHGPSRSVGIRKWNKHVWRKRRRNRRHQGRQSPGHPVGRPDHDLARSFEQIWGGVHPHPRSGRWRYLLCHVWDDFCVWTVCTPVRRSTFGEEPLHSRAVDLLPAGTLPVA
uniref:(northern house mosquito) hypothetical protein n=1 Tax=Culex pipiens TaxID=7175 RepID=A0A8D8AGW6_CULPI